MTMDLEQRVERLEKKVKFLSTQQKEILNHITELFNKLKARIDLSSSQSIQHSQVTAIEDTGKTIQHSQVTAIEVSTPMCSFETSQQNKIAASMGSFFMPVKRLTKEFGPKYCSKSCFSIHAGENDVEFDLGDGIDKFLTTSNVKPTFCAAIISTRNAPRIQLQINPVLKILEDKDVLKGEGMLQSCFLV